MWLALDASLKEVNPFPMSLLMLLVLTFRFPWARWRWGKARAKLRWREFDRVPPKDIGSASRTFTWQLCGFPSWRRNSIVSNRIPTSGKGMDMGVLCDVTNVLHFDFRFVNKYHRLQNKCYPQRCFYLAISKLHSILLAHNKKSQICYCGLISLQSPTVIYSFFRQSDTFGVNMHFAGDGTFA